MTEIVRDMVFSLENTIKIVEAVGLLLVLIIIAAVCIAEIGRWIGSGLIGLIRRK